MPGLMEFLRGNPRLSRRWRAGIDDHVVALAWSPKGDRLAAAAVGGPLTLFDAANGQVVRTLPGHNLGTAALSWQPDGALLASGGQDGKVLLWDAVSGEPRAVLAGGAAWVEHVSWSPAGDALASAAGKKLRLWSPQGTLLREFADHPATIADLSCRPGTGELTSATYGGVALWRRESAEPLMRLEWKGSVLKLAWAPSGEYLAHGNQDSTVHFWVLRSGQDLQMSGYPMKVRELAWDPTGTYLATGGGPAVTVWDCSGRGPENTEPLTFKGHDEPISVLTYQAHGPFLASGGQDGRVFLFQPGRFKKFLTRADLEGPISQVVWSPDDRLLAVATEQGEVAVYGLM
jgi:WD40 repeat protein